MIDPLTDEIRHATRIRAVPERVYDALTTAPGLDAWFTSGAEVDPRPGGRILFRWRDWGPDRVTGEDGGPVLAAERPRRFVFQWSPDHPGYATTVELELEAVGEHTVVRVREHGYHDTPGGRRAMLDCAAGWGEALTLLKLHLEHGVHYESPLRLPQRDATMPIAPVVLSGREVRLEPLSRDHISALCEVGLDPELWRWTLSLVRTPDDMRRYVESALAAQAAGAALPFAIVHRPSGRVVGSTRFGNIERAHRRVEIGWSWVARAWQRTAVNTESKLLLLRHAFETLGCHRVEFKTDALNQRSRSALLRIGAVEEGTLREHMVTEAGRVRDTVYFSVLRSEWPSVEARLRERIAAAMPPAGPSPSRA